MMPVVKVLAGMTVLIAVAVSASAQIRSYDEVCRDIAASGPEAAEGIWRLTDADNDGALVAIERNPETPGSYRITLVEAADRSLIPGTLLGEATRGARRGEYDAWMWAAAPLPGVGVKRRKRFTLTLTDGDTRLVFKPHRSPWAVNLYMSLPYLFIRPSIRNERHVERTAQGAERVFPIPVPPIEPVYL